MRFRTLHDLACDDCGEPMNVMILWKLFYAKCWKCHLRIWGIVRTVLKGEQP